MNSTFITAKRLAFSSRYRRFLYPRPRIQEPAISAAESQALGRDERRIHRSSQNEGSRVKWHLLTNSRSEPYFQMPHSGIKETATNLSAIIPNASFPPSLGFVELPYSQGPSFFNNLVIYHEIGHFVYQELSIADGFASEMIRCLQKNVTPDFPRGSPKSGHRGSLQNRPTINR